MRFSWKPVLTLFAALLLPAACGTAFGEDPAGVVRISDAGSRPAASRSVPTGVVYRAQSPDWVVGGCPCGTQGCDMCADGTCGCGSPGCRCGRQGRWRRGFRRNDLHIGNGTYDIVYTVDPWYVDRRDTRVYSAWGYGVPMAVPLAPNVEHTYNHGWGVPSSRLTHISRPRFP